MITELRLQSRGVNRVGRTRNTEVNRDSGEGSWVLYGGKGAVTLFSKIIDVNIIVPMLPKL